MISVAPNSSEVSICCGCDRLMVALRALLLFNHTIGGQNLGIRGSVERGGEILSKFLKDRRGDPPLCTYCRKSGWLCESAERTIAHLFRLAMVRGRNSIKIYHRMVKSGLHLCRSLSVFPERLIEGSEMDCVLRCG